MGGDYTLAIKFNSNERPYSTIYKPGRPITDDTDAIRWARGMSEGLGRAYSVILLKDGHAMEVPDDH